MDRIATIYFDDRSPIRIPIETFGLNSIAEYIIDCGIYKPGHIVDIKVQTVYKEEK